MKKITTTLIALTALTWLSAEAQRFQRNDVEGCATTRMQEMGIATMDEAREICQNYTDDNLNCAANTMRTYKTDEYYPAIQYCILKFSNRALQGCMRDKMNVSLRAGTPANISLARVECEDQLANPSPAPAQPVTRPRTTRDPIFTDTPNDSSNRTFADRSFGLPGYDFKIPVDKVKVSIAQWLGIRVGEVPKVSVERYFHVVDAAIEDTAIMAGTRAVRLHDVRFVLEEEDSQSRSRVSRLVVCTGTDFAPLDNMVETRYFVLHECAIEGDEEAFRSVTRNINYEFLNDIPGNFQDVMREANQNWSGSGNISFDTNISDYLIINY